MKNFILVLVFLFASMIYSDARADGEGTSQTDRSNIVQMERYEEHVIDKTLEDQLFLSQYLVLSAR